MVEALIIIIIITGLWCVLNNIAWLLDINV